MLNFQCKRNNFEFRFLIVPFMSKKLSEKPSDIGIKNI